MGLYHVSHSVGGVKMFFCISLQLFWSKFVFGLATSQIPKTQPCLLESSYFHQRGCQLSNCYSEPLGQDLLFFVSKMLQSINSCFSSSLLAPQSPRNKCLRSKVYVPPSGINLSYWSAEAPAPKTTWSALMIDQNKSRGSTSASVAVAVSYVSDVGRVSNRT